MPPGPAGNRFLPFGWGGVLAALPFAIWFYLAIEELPLAAEEAHAPERDLPRGILLGLATLVVCAFLTLILSAGIAPGAAELGRSLGQLEFELSKNPDDRDVKTRIAQTRELREHFLGKQRDAVKAKLTAVAESARELAAKGEGANSGSGEWFFDMD